MSKLNTEAQWKISICESTLQWLTDFHNRETLRTDWRRDFGKKFISTIHPLKSTARESPLSSDHFQPTALRVQAGHRAATCCHAHKGAVEGNSSVQVLCWNQGTQTYIFQKQKSGKKVSLNVPLGNWQKTYKQSGKTEKLVWYKRISVTLGMRNSSEKVIAQLERNARHGGWNGHPPKEQIKEANGPIPNSKCRTHLSASRTEAIGHLHRESWVRLDFRFTSHLNITSYSWCNDSSNITI